jgi:hypothetical protein
MCDPAQIFLTSKISYLLSFSNHSHKNKTGTANWWETTNTNPLQRVRLSSQLTTDVTLCSAMYWPHHLVHKCKAQSHSDWCRWFATNSLLRICGLSFHFRTEVEKKTRLNWDMRNIVARSHSEHLWDCSKDWHTLGEETQSDGHNIKGVRKISIPTNHVLTTISVVQIGLYPMVA